ncbi:adenylate/guanylate cyclase domain-containing protein [Rhodococcus pyridinivorans]|uniref:adenylate/guanylate cyclase domain-containing protein n=1 Tax=Rhodococcus pyridinivorans TaxID=103816 RepID=UPI002284BC94|nr:adenylate/guanylate cyclase domain-containing protein [Rhodococcus pyridinivorans]WAL46563.1 hypothetical protein OQN32_00125 [Rhodococcus pyridinivorans]
MTDVALSDLLAQLDSRVKTELQSTPDVQDKGSQLDVNALPITARIWHKASDVVAVYADLKNSSQLGVRIHAASTASVYEAAVGGLVEILDRFGADYLDIQGDAAFGVFWGDRRYERAMCAGITVKTFSSALTDRLENKWNDQPETGFRVGVAASPILVKRIGTPRNLAQQKPVWAGRAVNYASKSASAGERHELVVTGTVWDRIEKNDYLTVTCGCGDGPSTNLWKDVTIGRLREGDDAEAAGRLLTSSWCETHGDEFCQAILNGQTKRSDVPEVLRKTVLNSQFQEAFRKRAHQVRMQRRGLTGGR